MTTYNNFSEYMAAQAAGKRDIKFVSLKETKVPTHNGISSHLKHTVAAIQANELNYVG